MTIFKKSKVTIFSLSAWLFALFFLTSAGVASAAASWTTPASLTTVTLFNLPTNNASVAVNPNGDSVAVWINESNYVVQYAQRKNGVWSAAKALYTPSATKNETTSSAHVVMKADGTAVAIFSSTTPGVLQYCSSGGRVVRCLGPSKSFAKMATLAVGATAWTKVNLSAQGVLVDDTQIAIDTSGNVLAFWSYQQSTGLPTELQTANQPANGVWSTPQTVYSSSNSLSLATLSMGASCPLLGTPCPLGTFGHAVLAWQERQSAGTGGIFKIRAVYRDSTGVWNQVEDVASPSAQIWRLRSGMDGSGLATLVWDNNYSVQLSRRIAINASVPWSSAETLASVPGTQYGASGPFTAYTPDLAVNTAGDVLVGWLENDVSTGLWTIEAQLLSATGVVESSSSWPVDPQTGSAYPSVTMSQDGSIGSIAWVDNGTGNANAATFLTPASGWSQPLVIGTGLWDSQIALGSGLNAKASAIWLTNTATEFKYKYMGSSYLP